MQKLCAFYAPSTIRKLPSSHSFRRAVLDDLDALAEFESLCFDEARRDTRGAIRYSLTHPRFETWVLKNREGRVDASLFLRPYHSSLRIYSLATHPDLRGLGWGNRLLDFAVERAKDRHIGRLSLEVDASNPQLLEWYQNHGFYIWTYLHDYYGEDRSGWRMRRDISLREGP